MSSAEEVSIGRPALALMRSMVADTDDPAIPAGLGERSKLIARLRRHGYLAATDPRSTAAGTWHELSVTIKGHEALRATDVDRRHSPARTRAKADDVREPHPVGLEPLCSRTLDVLRVIDAHPECSSVNIAVRVPADVRGSKELFVALYERGYIDGFPVTVPGRLYPLTWEALVLTDKGRAAIAA